MKNLGKKEKLKTKSRKVKKSKSHGLKSVKTEMLKDAWYLTLETLRIIFNKVLQTGTTAKAWQVDLNKCISHACCLSSALSVNVSE